MSHAHGHETASTPVGSVQVRRSARLVLHTFLVLVAVATLVGLVVLWPGSDSRARAAAAGQFLADGASIETAKVVAIRPSDCAASSTGGGSVSPSTSACEAVSAVVSRGQHRGDSATVTVGSEVRQAGLQVGDTIQLLRTPSAGAGSSADYSFFDIERKLPLWVLGFAFAAVVVAVGRLRGLFALLALGFAGIVLVKFLIPALLQGESSLAVGLVGSTAIMYVVLYLAHGPSTRTSTALTGTLLGLLVTAAVGVLAVHTARLTGLSSDENALLSSVSTNVNLHGLVTCGLIVAGLGVLNDVTITQTSAVWELRAAAPHLRAAALFTSAMRIGRDHIASSVYTIVFAYAGAALPTLMLIELYPRPLTDILASEDIAEEIVRTLSSAIGLVLAVPITTGIAVLVVSLSQGGRRRT